MATAVVCLCLTLKHLQGMDVFNAARLALVDTMNLWIQRPMINPTQSSELAEPDYLTSCLLSACKAVELCVMRAGRRRLKGGEAV